MRANSLFTLSASVIATGALSISAPIPSTAQASEPPKSAQVERSNGLALTPTDPPWACTGGQNSQDCPQKEDNSKPQAPAPALPEEPPAPAETVPALPGQPAEAPQGDYHPPSL
jgi:hypothetical protein